MAVGSSTGLTYSGYLALDEVLAAQRPVSDVHDELLFIVVHQVHELWFKQMLHELGQAQARLVAGETERALRSLQRLRTVLEATTVPIGVMETMTPQEFALFRDRLGTSSGFQSVQFREVEAVLGGRRRQAIAHLERDSEERRRVEAAMNRPSLLDSALVCLALHGYPVPLEILQRDTSQPLAPHEELRHALTTVRDEDGPEARMCEELLAVDRGLREWRRRHVEMVERMIGAQPGTAGSAGAAYLRTTLATPYFPDLWEVWSR
ncbi:MULTISPECIES: tryptophan 2,3-dioxygenase [Streptomyces]|uniref:tryptophan 2,3-dioxygenase n=2 Tax=Actinomycetes TaxID=1760 RepID=UPI00017E8C62|nr:MULTISPECIES: tryptophan 2,3-dioxygenase family protein [Streptomyces]AKL71138.1 tryptophan 2,3-dioxygenase [Streptomyces sp. Mg1]EDX26135.1 tryptophan 2,3-dioxygenase [Streptomyces sp. Mg1]WSS04038.1 tryptophan 2,3-dioxygenase family protein [Streptomyces goshikiensis]